MKYSITFSLTKEEVQSLQNALSFAAWQFREGGDDESAKDADVIDMIREEIYQEFGIKGVH